MRLSRIVIASWILVACAPCLAAVKTFTNNGGFGDGNWGTASNWSGGTLPGAADRVVIPLGQTCTVNVSYAYADTIDVVGTLIVTGGNTLTLDNDNENVAPQGDPDESIIDGTVRLEIAGTGGSIGAVLAFVDSNHSISGPGKLEGSGLAATVAIEGNKTLTNLLDGSDVDGGFHDTLTVTASVNDNPCTFHNRGKVDARSHKGQIHFTDSVNLTDTGDDGVEWLASNCADIRVDRAATGLNAPIACWVNGGGGDLIFNADVTTCGLFTYNAGTITLGAGAEFRYAAFAGTCTNPGSVTGSPNCGNPWVVSATDQCSVCK